MTTEAEKCNLSPTGVHSESWYGNGDCEHCKTGAVNKHLYWHDTAKDQAMTTEAERDCKHGQLARSCNVCELESEVARQAAEIERKDALLRQALGALSDYDYDKRLASIAAIKQHLGEV